MLRRTLWEYADKLYVDGVVVRFTMAREGTKVSMHPSVYYLTLTRTAGRLWLLHGLGQLLLQRKHLY